MGVVKGWAFREEPGRIYAEQTVVTLYASAALTEEARCFIEVWAETPRGDIVLSDIFVSPGLPIDYDLVLHLDYPHSEEDCRFLLSWRRALQERAEEVLPDLLRRFCETQGAFKARDRIEEYLRNKGIDV